MACFQILVLKSDEQILEQREGGGEGREKKRSIAFAWADDFRLAVVMFQWGIGSVSCLENIVDIEMWDFKE